MRRSMEHYGQGISFVERACIFKTKEENEFLLKPIILIGTDILTESPLQVLESKSLAFTNSLSYHIIISFNPNRFIRFDWMLNFVYTH